jgi:hypothetical protein
MPTELVLIGGILVVAAGGLFFVLLRRSCALGNISDCRVLNLLY